MGAVNTTYTFLATDTITSTKMNNIIDETVITADAISGTTLEVTGTGKLKIRSQGITSNEMGTDSVTTTSIASSSGASNGVTYAKIQHVANMKVIGNVTGSLAAPSEVSILDEDDMVSDSATSLATQQSIKAYVDNKLARGTALDTTSGTSFDFTSIPSNVKRITFVLDGVSTNGTSPIIIQLGDSGGIEITDYYGSASEIKGTPTSTSFTTGFGLVESPAAGDFYYGIVTIANVSGNLWVYSFTGSSIVAAQTYLGGGSKILSATLDRIRLTTSGGANTFDAGKINILYE
jgi:hypothetical protein